MSRLHEVRRPQYPFLGKDVQTLLQILANTEYIELRSAGNPAANDEEAGGLPDEENEKEEQEVLSDYSMEHLATGNKEEERILTKKRRSHLRHSRSIESYMIDPEVLQSLRTKRRRVDPENAREENKEGGDEAVVLSQRQTDASSQGERKKDEEDEGAKEASRDFAHSVFENYLKQLDGLLRKDKLEMLKKIIKINTLFYHSRSTVSAWGVLEEEEPIDGSMLRRADIDTLN